MTELNIIAAYAINAHGEKVIGLKNCIPWEIKNDLQYFKKTTLGSNVIMGKNTFQSLKSPLPDRKNIIMTRSKFKINDKNCATAQNANSAISLCDKDKKIFIIGGEQIYKIFMGFSTRLYITEIHHHIEGDKYFPYIPAKLWKKKIIDQTKENINNKEVSVNYCIFDRAS